MPDKICKNSYIKINSEIKLINYSLHKIFTNNNLNNANADERNYLLLLTTTTTTTTTV